jgi:flagellar FliJ protein
MQRFRFSLDPVLSHRKRREQEAQMELARQHRALEREEAAARALQLELRRHEEHRARQQVGAIDIRELLQAQEHTDALTRALTCQQERIAAAARAVETARGELHRRRVDRESLERLRERRLAEHQAEALRIEQQFLDEAAVLRWRR